jgi:bifunctional DNA-binding transcriptional regulator/antitoxin component of YhaV-PrlF toxin-antitoxin module
MDRPAQGESLRFRGVIEAARGGGAVVLVPPEVGAALGGNKQMRVFGTVNGVAYRSSTMPYRGAFYMGVHKATREAAGVAIGDEVEVTVTRDDSPRVLVIPPDLETALAADPALRARFDKLSSSHRREFADSVAEAKRPETRARRIETTLARLRELG